MTARHLPSPLVDRILVKLDLPATLPRDLSGLSRLYRAWCSRVPFDNIRKRIHLASGSSAPLPGDDIPAFFEAWLRHGTGGTCWAGNAALYALVTALGFDARPGLATMQTDPYQPPNHGTVMVRLEDRQVLVDASVLHGTPLELPKSGQTRIHHPAWGLTCRALSSGWQIRWRPLHMLQGLSCRIHTAPADLSVFRKLNEKSRACSPFNHRLYIRINRTDEVIGISDGTAVTLSNIGSIIRTPLSHHQRLETAETTFGIHPDILSRNPPDQISPLTRDS